ncbi:cytochrome c biogenesis protein [Lishizhenia sp.]|uniref:cytochrome c biogenesis protein n=1 Tax=Lishizhenia sp. TaxID=2497594 RepID=UPI00299E55B8|nr:cytochrome c biogenesis protein CcsA [Lishizhenia sp.]MDX1446339.1 cytochrome c biogenesis protein CcsA [Lishizhenia sp.]
MEKVIRGIFSMGAMTLGLVAFAVAIGYATFIESSYGTPASKIAVFNATWFEILLTYLCFALIANIFRYKMYKAEKVAMFTFHLSFIIIIIGSGVTRFFGYEGMMPIAEGESTNIIFTATPNVQVKIDDGTSGVQYREARFLSEAYDNPFEQEIQFGNYAPINVSYVDYEENLVNELISNDTTTGTVLEFVVRGQSKFLNEGESMLIGTEILAYEDHTEGFVPDVKLFFEGNTLMAQSLKSFNRVNMAMLSVEDRQTGNVDSNAILNVPSDSAVEFAPRYLYQFTGEQIMFKAKHRNSAYTEVRSNKKDAGTNYLTIKIEQDGKSELKRLPYQNGSAIKEIPFQFNGLNYMAGYGPVPVELPFYIKCRDFQLDRYAGSDMASSYASEVSVIDSVKGVHKDQRIFMNNVMDYGGFRFFQSNYFPDETGTILSVNHDWWGTNITYLGYLLMSIGMVLSLIAPISRFRELNKMIQKSREKRSQLMSVVVALFFSTLAFGQDAKIETHSTNGDNEKVELSEDAHQGHDHSDHDGHDHAGHDHTGHDHASHEGHNHAPAATTQQEVPADFNFEYISEQHAEELSSLLVQDLQGRNVPFHTLADKMLRKIHRAQTFEGHNAVQVAMSWLMAGPKWVDRPVVYVSSKIRDSIHTEKYASLKELSQEGAIGNFKWLEAYNTAHNKPDSRKNEFDKEIIRLGERFNYLFNFTNYSFKYLKVVPVKGDVMATWMIPHLDWEKKDEEGMSLLMDYLSLTIRSNDSEENQNQALETLAALKKYQRAEGTSVDTPSESEVKIEIMYNNMNIFKNTQNAYLVIGLLLLIIFFIRTLTVPTQRSEKLFKRISLPFIILGAIVFLYHLVGLFFRSYITGEVPWTNGYEAIIYIAWILVMAGFIFIKKNPVILGASIILSALLLFVTELNLLDPEIGNMQPVLKSYWLMIHVAIITASYGFLGLSAILGLVNMALYLARTQKNGKRLNMNINEITYVSEMTMTVGLFMLTIGTFLGGVWANESWGRYWGWDPKETWALVSVLTYAIILHLRYIPGLKDKFIFNLVSLWGYGSIIFTFFGVNFKLTGLHSYAQGDGVAETPEWVYTTVYIFLAFSLLSGIRYYMFKKQK